jgi:hypothetical protein
MLRGLRNPGSRVPIGRALVAVVAFGVAACEEGTPPTPSEPGRYAGAPAAEAPGANGDRRAPGGPAEPGDGPPGVDDEPTERDDRWVYEPAPPVLPRLTASQYRNTLEDIFGGRLPRLDLEKDTNPHLFYSIGAAREDVSANGVDLYSEAAFTVAAWVFTDAARREVAMGCAPESADDGCMRGFVETIGRRLFRRSLTEDERTRWMAVAVDTADGDPLRGAETALAGMLQSPNFLYRPELGEPHPAFPDRLRYTSHEMASRLAYLLTNSGPDEVLLAAADRGELRDRRSIAEHATRLLETPRARDAVQDFFAQYLDIGRLAQVELDPAAYPGFSRRLVEAMATEVRLLVDDVVFRQGGDVRALFSARRGYVNSDLADLYGIEAPGATQAAFVPVEFAPDVPRAGVLTLGAFLTMNAHPSETSPTLRGKYIRERVLCQEVPPPPDDVDLNLEPEGEEATTLRERLEQHMEDPQCKGCHSWIDPPGFLFEHYDSMGRYRESVDGYPVDATGDFDGTPLDDATDLAALLAGDPRVGHCIAKQLYRYGSGRLDTLGERSIIDELDAAFAASGYDFQALLVALATSEGFRTLAPPETEAPAAEEGE